MLSPGSTPPQFYRMRGDAFFNRQAAKRNNCFRTNRQGTKHAKKYLTFQEP